MLEIIKRNGLEKRYEKEYATDSWHDGLLNFS